MNKSKIIIKDRKFLGTLDFYVIRNVHNDLEDIGINCTYQEMFSFISTFKDLGTDKGQITLCSLLLHSILRCSHIAEEEFVELFNSDTSEDEMELMNIFQRRFDYINSLFKKCMPPNANEDSEFDDDIYISKKDNWDFNHMEYLWYSILKRSDDFYSITPKTFFAQLDELSKANSKNGGK